MSNVVKGNPRSPKRLHVVLYRLIARVRGVPPRSLKQYKKNKKKKKKKKGKFVATRGRFFFSFDCFFLFIFFFGVLGLFVTLFKDGRE
jgi:hypothetical protein